MAMADIIPQLGDKELGNLHANALRLEGTGAPAQQKAAAEMLPLITAELEAREARKPTPVAKARKTAVKKTAAKKKTAAAADADAS
jgi:hypothetical protein